MTEMEAVIGSIQLEKLANFNEKRREHSLYIYEGIRDLDWVDVQDFSDDIEHTFFWCPFYVDEAKIRLTTAEVRDQLHDMGIGNYMPQLGYKKA